MLTTSYEISSLNPPHVEQCLSASESSPTSRTAQSVFSSFSADPTTPHPLPQNHSGVSSPRAPRTDSLERRVDAARSHILPGCQEEIVLTPIHHFPQQGTTSESFEMRRIDPEPYDERLEVTPILHSPQQGTTSESFEMRRIGPEPLIPNTETPSNKRISSFTSTDPVDEDECTAFFPYGAYQVSVYGQDGLTAIQLSKNILSGKYEGYQMDLLSGTLFKKAKDGTMTDLVVVENLQDQDNDTFLQMDMLRNIFNRAVAKKEVDLDVDPSERGRLRCPSYTSTSPYGGTRASIQTPSRVVSMTRDPLPHEDKFSLATGYIEYRRTQLTQRRDLLLNCAKALSNPSDARSPEVSTLLQDEINDQDPARRITEELKRLDQELRKHEDLDLFAIQYWCSRQQGQPFEASLPLECSTLFISERKEELREKIEQLEQAIAHKHATTGFFRGFRHPKCSEEEHAYAQFLALASESSNEREFRMNCGILGAFPYSSGSRALFQEFNALFDPDLSQDDPDALRQKYVDQVSDLVLGVKTTTSIEFLEPKPAVTERQELPPGLPEDPLTASDPTSPTTPLSPASPFSSDPV